jgi:hypothetical protein
VGDWLARWHGCAEWLLMRKLVLFVVPPLLKLVSQ